MVSCKNIFLLASVASAMVLEKRGTYLDLYTDIGKGMREIQIQTEQWNIGVYPDAIITAINQMNDAIAAADRRTRNDGGTLEDRDSLALIHFIHLVSCMTYSVSATVAYADV
ncbi:hypothetical protein Tdes44962_MAKER00614 [Teratosphaeria destructans]|uniref:Uncharacterized protein n=1 Tax=Teratosphaeria destructans TaxID=418781 RepID=A0A9W7W0W1_9PEZI|nr:hypothetical protein Tdes44962_MAKER00614 [Teratosphaeria destructans]